jgi:hypothetical protein
MDYSLGSIVVGCVLTENFLLYNQYKLNEWLRGQEP